MRILAIDFETANEQRASACAVGLAWIEDGTIVRSESRLIRPKDMRFSPMNVSIHGIQPSDVAAAPEFPEALGDVLEDISSHLVIAHNAAFDMSVWRHALEAYGVQSPTFDYLCTLKLAQGAWPDLVSYRLPDIAQFLGIPLRHHDAREDAVACASIAVALSGDVSHRNLAEAASAFGLSMGKIGPGIQLPCSAGVGRLSLPAMRETTAVTGDMFAGQCVVFTGTLETMTRTQAERLVISLGGQVARSVTRRTSLVVAGPGAGSKLASARELGTTLLDEDGWFELLSRA